MTLIPQWVFISTQSSTHNIDISFRVVFHDDFYSIGIDPMAHLNIAYR